MPPTPCAPVPVPSLLPVLACECSPLLIESFFHLFIVSMTQGFNLFVIQSFSSTWYFGLQRQLHLRLREFVKLDGAFSQNLALVFLRKFFRNQCGCPREEPIRM